MLDDKEKHCDDEGVITGCPTPWCELTKEGNGVKVKSQRTDSLDRVAECTKTR